jgi:hypothetical protein
MTVFNGAAPAFCVAEMAVCVVLLAWASQTFVGYCVFRSRSINAPAINLFPNEAH